jgi:hypothetical protein
VQSDQYSYVWKTEQVWGGTCRQLLVIFKDGSVHYSNIRFKEDPNLGKPLALTHCGANPGCGGRTALRGPSRAAGREVRDLARSPQASRAVRRICRPDLRRDSRHSASTQVSHETRFVTTKVTELRQRFDELDRGHPLKITGKLFCLRASLS